MTSLDPFLPLAIAAFVTAFIFAVHCVVQVFTGEDQKPHSR